jgi:hypothetical protein
MALALEAVYAAALESFDGVFTADALLAEAEAATGLSNWGGTRWHEGKFRALLNALCQSLENEAALTKQGRSRAHSRLHTMLCSRLRQVDWRAQRPEGAPIVKPLIGTGLPRAGTTFLHNLLAQDPDNLSATAAEAAIPVPPPGPDDGTARTTLYRRILDFQGLTTPDVTAIHPYAAEVPEECVFLQEASGASLYNAYFNAPPFVQLSADAAGTGYAWQIGMMQTLQEGRSFARWALKAPGHMVTWDLLIASFPDARIFLNHRDPGKVFPSVGGLYAKLRSVFSDQSVDQKKFVRQLVTNWAAILDKVTAWRAAHPEIKVVDVLYTKLIADPIGEAERLYAAFGLELRPQTKSRMEQFLKRDHHGKGPARSYSLADYGLDEADIEKAFGPYLDHYGIAREARR